MEGVSPGVCGEKPPNNFWVGPIFLLIRKKSIHEKLCVVLVSRSKNVFHATVGPERVYSHQIKFQCAPLISTLLPSFRLPIPGVKYLSRLSPVSRWIFQWLSQCCPLFLNSREHLLCRIVAKSTQHSSTRGDCLVCRKSLNRFTALATRHNEIIHTIMWGIEAWFSD